MALFRGRGLIVLYVTILCMLNFSTEQHKAQILRPNDAAFFQCEMCQRPRLV